MTLRRGTARTVTVAAVLAASQWLAACSYMPSLPSLPSSWSPMSWFGADKPKPKPLLPITAQIGGKVVWNQRIEGVQFPLAVAVNGDTFTVAGTDGTVLALSADTGREIWRASVGTKLSAGVGSDGRIAAVATRTGEVVALQAGRVLWRQPVATRVTTPPLVAGERVFVLGVDRRVTAFDAQDGTPLWSIQRPGDPLTLAQAGVISAFKNTLLVGQGARLAGLDPANGAVRWEVTLASPRGTNEVERLADLVGPASRVGDVVCARAFQSAVACANAERGVLQWTKNIGGVNGIAADAEFVFGADASDRISAWKAATGDSAWSTEALLNHGLSAPLSVGRTVIFGSADGTLHFLSRDKGEALLRLPTDGSAVVAAPALATTAAGPTMLVVTRNGGLFGVRAE